MEITSKEHPPAASAVRRAACTGKASAQKQRESKPSSVDTHAFCTGLQEGEVSFGGPSILVVAVAGAALVVEFGSTHCTVLVTC
eukprot:6201673-Pleurochrysis_carterae.AAC.2